MGTIEDLIRYRIENEKTLERIVETNFPTDFGDFKLLAYEDAIDQELHLAIVKGEINPDEPVAVRVHVQNTLHDSLCGTAGRGWPLQDVMKKIDGMGNGVIVFLRQSETPRQMVLNIETIMRGEDHHDKHDASHAEDLRTFGIGAQILADLGIHKMKLLSAPKKFHGLAGFGLEVVEYISD